MALPISPPYPPIVRYGSLVGTESAKRCAHDEARLKPSSQEYEKR